MNGKTKVILKTFLLMLLLQAVREGAERLIAPAFPDTRFAGQMCTCCVMALLTAGIVLFARRRGWAFTFFPKPFGKKYVIFTCIAAVLYVLTPSNFTDGLPAVLLLVYGSIVTPVYEEIVFRGLIWNRCRAVMEKETAVYLWNVAFFTLWHLGYMAENLLEGNRSAVLWKIAAGLGYGIVLGFVRLKSKNTYAGVLAHGILNLFMV